MKVSANKYNEGFLFAPFAVIYLDGEIVHDCVSADDENGEVVILTFTDNVIGVETKKGRVVIINGQYSTKGKSA